MIGFQPYETFQLLIETGGTERANTLLVAACDAFARRGAPTKAESEQFEALARRLFPSASPAARAKAAAILASATALTPDLEIIIYDNLGAGLIDHLETAPNLSDDVMIRLIEKGDVAIIAALAKRANLSNAILSRLFPINSRKVYRVLAANQTIAPRGAVLAALTRSAQMDHEVAATLSQRTDFDAALLTPLFFELPEEGRMGILRAYSKRNLPQTNLMRTFENISVATGEFTTALMKLFAGNRRPKITQLIHQITGLDELRCGEIAHDTSGAALFVVLRAFGCDAYDGLKVLIHATSHDGDRSRTLASFARLFEDVDVAAMVYVMSVWRGEAKTMDLARPEYGAFAPQSARTPSQQHSGATAGQQALEALDTLKSTRKSA